MNKFTLVVNGISYRSSDNDQATDLTFNDLQKVANSNDFLSIVNDDEVCQMRDDENACCQKNIDDLSDVSAPTKKPVPKKRVRQKVPNPAEWAQNRRKRLRQAGKSYVTRSGVVVPEKTFSIKDCGCCPAKCRDHFTVDELREMFANFWQIDLQNKRQYLAQLVEETDVKRVRTKSAHSRRSLTRHYYLIKNATQREKVCRAFFMDVFKVSSNFIRTVCKKRSKSGIVEKDLRGKCAPPVNKRPDAAREFIRNHINRCRRRPRRNTRTRAGKEYLPAGLSLTKMYNAYVTECERGAVQPEKYWLYADVFHKYFNLHFCKPAMCAEAIVLKRSSRTTSKDTNDELSRLMGLEVETVVDDSIEPTIVTVMADDSGAAYPVDVGGESLVHYKSMYEEEAKKNERLQKEIQRLNSLLKNKRG